MIHFIKQSVCKLWWWEQLALETLVKYKCYIKSSSWFFFFTFSPNQNNYLKIYESRYILISDMIYINFHYQSHLWTRSTFIFYICNFITISWISCTLVSFNKLICTVHQFYDRMVPGGLCVPAHTFQDTKEVDFWYITLFQLRYIIYLS